MKSVVTAIVFTRSEHAHCRYLFWVLRLLVLLAAALPDAVSQSLPKAPGAEITVLTPTPGFFTEPAVAVNPYNPQQVVAVFQDNAHAAYSEDAGRTWRLAEGVEPKNYRVSGDVSTAFDRHGHAFIAYMAFDKLGTFNYWAHNATRNGLFIARSLDGGKTWEPNHSAVIVHDTEPGIPWEDKPYIVSDTSQGRFAGNLYVGWTRWTLTDSEILLSRSLDDGKTWSKPIELNKHPGLPRDDNGAAEGFDGVVAPDGTLYLIWCQDDQIMFTSSRDGGRTFSHPRAILHTGAIMFAVETLERANGFAQIAASSRRLYVTWSDYRNGDLDVFCASSADNGRTWTNRVRVNNDPIHNGADQFFQWLAVDPNDGAVNVMFYDRRDDPENRKQIVVLARSTDNGSSFANYAWTEKPFEARGVFFGDYTGLAAFGGRVYGAWTEKPTAEPGCDCKMPKQHSARQGTVVTVGVADFTRKQEAKAVKVRD
jgi:hypothetical protein